MQFKKREEYSLSSDIDRDGEFYQISQDEFVHCSFSYRRVITWMKGNFRTEKTIGRVIPLGVVGNSFFFKMEEKELDTMNISHYKTYIQKAELVNDTIEITESVQIGNEMIAYFSEECLNYFVAKINDRNVPFAVRINEHYLSENRIKFNFPIVLIHNFVQIHVHNNFLFGMLNANKSCYIRRYQSGSEVYLEKEGLPMVYGGSKIFNNCIFYFSFGNELVIVNMNDLSYERMKTKCELPGFDCSLSITGIDEKGMVHARSFGFLFAARLPELYIFPLCDPTRFLKFKRGHNLTQIDDGGQGTVFKGSFNVAVKQYKRGGLERELEILKRLNHPNIIQFFGIGEIDGSPVTVLECCPTSLRKIINECSCSEQAIERTEFSRIAREIAEGLRYLHLLKIIHCDIKPDNILLAPDKTVKICDFGTAKDQNKKKLSKSIEGSTPWMAPEYIRGDPFDNTIDIWSYGIVIWELISLRLPFDGIPSEQLYNLIGGGNGLLPILTGSFLSLEDLFNACWERNKEDRINFERIPEYLRNVNEELEKITDEQWLEENRKWWKLARLSNWRNA